MAPPTRPARSTTTSQARGPAGLHPAPARVLLIGMGTGATAEAFLALPTVQALTVVELDSNMRRLLPHFGTQAITDDPRLRIVDGDGRWFVRADEGAWDVIAVDAFDPRTASATFYTAEFYAEARERLAPGGLLFVKFNPASVTEPEPLAGYLATLWSVFPDGALVFVQRGLFGLVGTADRSTLVLSEDRVVAEFESGSPLVAKARCTPTTGRSACPDRPPRTSGFIEPLLAGGPRCGTPALGRRRAPAWATLKHAPAADPLPVGLPRPRARAVGASHLARGRRWGRRPAHPGPAIGL